MRSSKETVPLYTLTLILTHEYVGWSNDTFDLYIGVVKAWYFEKYVRSYCVKLSGIIWYIRSVLHILCKIASTKSARAQALAVFGYFGCFHKTRHLPTRPRFVQLAARATHCSLPMLPNMGLNQTYTSSCNAWGKCYIWKDSDFEETKGHPQIWALIYQQPSSLQRYQVKSSAQTQTTSPGNTWGGTRDWISWGGSWSWSWGGSHRKVTAAAFFIALDHLGGVSSKV